MTLTMVQRTETAPTSLPHCMGATGSSPTMPLVLERMQSMHAAFPAQICLFLEPRTCPWGRQHVQPLAPHGALPPSFLAAGISRISGTATLVALLHGKATSKSSQLHPASADPPGEGPSTSTHQLGVLEGRYPADTASWQRPIAPSASPNRNPHPGPPREQPPLCISVSHLSQRDQALKALLAVILSPTPKLSYRCHGIACSQHPPAPPVSLDGHAPPPELCSPGYLGQIGGSCRATNASPVGHVLGSCGCPALATSQGCRGLSQWLEETFGFDSVPVLEKHRCGRLSPTAPGEGPGCGRGHWETQLTTPGCWHP